MRFTRKNWNKFFDGSGKRTTIRLKASRIGHHKGYAGSYMKPEVLGEFQIVSIEQKEYGKLNVFDAIEDGFSTLQELKAEFERLNGKIADETIVYKHYLEQIKEGKG